MKKYLFIITLIWVCTAVSCSNFRRDTVSTRKSDNSNTQMPEILNSNYLNDVDYYVNYIKANGEQLDFIRKEKKGNKTIMGVLNNDTVRISVVGDSIKENTEVYYKNSEPVLLAREVILDVDSNYLETAYFKDNQIYKCFRDGVELTDKDSMKEFMAIVSNLK